MKNKILAVMMFLAFVFIGYVIYRNIQFNNYFMSQVDKDELASALKKRIEVLNSIVVRNDMTSDIFVEFVRNGESIAHEVAVNGIAGNTQGRVRIFVPEKKGWYTIEYPYPYPLTKQTLLDIPEPRWVAVNLSSLTNSVITGEVEYSVGRDEESEKGVVKDIKVTFEPGEGPKK